MSNPPFHSKNFNKYITNIEIRNLGNDKKYINENIFIKKNKELNVVKKNNNLFKKNTQKDLPKNDQNNQDITLVNKNDKIYKKREFMKLNTRPIVSRQEKTIIPQINLNKNFIEKRENIKNVHINHRDKILIYQSQNMHTEVIGMIMYNFKDFDIDIFHPHYNNPSNSIPYYEEIFKKSITYINDIKEELYKIIFVLTGGEINLLNVIDKKKYIIINHENGTIRKDFFNISLTPIVQSNYTLLPIYEYQNLIKRENQISIIGSLHTHQRDIPNILKLIINFPMYKICLFTRYVDPNNKALFLKHKNFIIYEKSDTKTMINQIRKSKFIFTADTLNYTEKGVRGGILTGMVPMGLNNNVPLILTKRLNIIYNLKGVLEYEKDIMELKEELIGLNPVKYNILLDKSKLDSKKICFENKIKFSIIKNHF